MGSSSGKGLKELGDDHQKLKIYDVSLVGLRKIEKKQLQKVSYVQNINTSITSIIPTLATVLTFIVHTLLGLSLNASDVSITV